MSDAEPGIRRVARAGGFIYLGPDGRRIRDPQVLARIRALAIPPAYRDVWICARADGHLQATGRDARGRKQYRYHPAWQQMRGQAKFASLRDFGQALPGIRRRLARLLGRGTTPHRQRVIAALVRLLDTTWMRIGNPAYARHNQSYGLSTLLCRHVRVAGDSLRLNFTGKSGVHHALEVTDPRVAAVVRGCRELPGQALFRYLDERGVIQQVGSADVNAWLAETTGQAITAKDFRTWHGSVHALALLLAGWGPQGPVDVKLGELVQAVARRLGNTPAVCRKAYIHPAILAWLTERPTQAPPEWLVHPPSWRGLHRAECQLMALLGHAGSGG